MTNKILQFIRHIAFAYAVFVITSFGLVSETSAQEQWPPAAWPIQFNHSGDDMVGERLAYKTREEIRASEGMRLADEDDVVITYLTVITIPRLKSDEAASSIYSYTLSYSIAGLQRVFGTTLIDAGVAYTGSQTVEESAESLAAFVDQNLDDIRGEVDNSLSNVGVTFSEWREMVVDSR